jgi:hypothetical protein
MSSGGSFVDSAAIPAILLGNGRRCTVTKQSAVLEFEGNIWIGVAVYEAGDEGRPSTLASWQMYRQGKRGLLAVSYTLGTFACCMTLSRVRLMGSNVLK